MLHLANKTKLNGKFGKFNDFNLLKGYDQGWQNSFPFYIFDNNLNSAISAYFGSKRKKIFKTSPPAKTESCLM